jgi:hypothetical protein
VLKGGFPGPFGTKHADCPDVNACGFLSRVKRSAALAGLSRDHHHALDAALRLSRADAGGLEAAVRNFHEFYTQRGDRHFEAEEAVLLPALPESDPDWAALCARVRSEHADLRRRGAEVGDLAAAHALGERLRDHVRFEERQLFEVLEERLGDDELERLGRELEAY